MYPYPDIGVQAARPKTAAADFHTASSNGQDKTKLDDPITAGNAHSNWAVAAVNNDCVGAWRNRLHDLGHSARAAAKAVPAAMDLYTGTDKSLAGRLNQDAASLEGA